MTRAVSHEPLAPGCVDVTGHLRVVPARIWLGCLAGREPAEQLPAALRASLVRVLLEELPPREVAAVTGLSTYTVCRIRARAPGSLASRRGVAA